MVVPDWAHCSLLAFSRLSGWCMPMSNVICNIWSFSSICDLATLPMLPVSPPKPFWRQSRLAPLPLMSSTLVQLQGHPNQPNPTIWEFGPRRRTTSQICCGHTSKPHRAGLQVRNFQSLNISCSKVFQCSQQPLQLLLKFACLLSTMQYKSTMGAVACSASIVISF